jgi:DnaJ-domain-containing protein 1
MAVSVELADGNRMEGALFISPQGRVLDMLNDERGFLPFETDDGGLTFLRKESIRRVTPISSSGSARNEGAGGASQGHPPPPPPTDPEPEDPYKMLGVAPEVDTEMLREVYRQRCREYHPDRLQALGLPKEFIDLATRRMAAINAAYDRIHELRRTA